MDTLGKFKTNFLKDRSSFKIGFNNRSPLSNLQGKLDGGIKSAESIRVPKLKSTIGKDGGSILVPDDGRLEAAEMVGKAIGEAGANIQKSIEKGVFNKIVRNLPEHFEKGKFSFSAFFSPFIRWSQNIFKKNAILQKNIRKKKL